jgi:hypothetical protein
VAPWAVALAVLATLLAGWSPYRQVRARQRAADRMRFIEDLFESVPARSRCATCRGATCT